MPRFFLETPLSEILPGGFFSLGLYCCLLRTACYPGVIPGGPMQKEKRVPLIITSLYAFIGAAWIYFSDRLLYLFAGTVEKIQLWETCKGWLYVAVTSVFL